MTGAIVLLGLAVIVQAWQLWRLFRIVQRLQVDFVRHLADHVRHPSAVTTAPPPEPPRG